MSQPQNSPDSNPSDRQGGKFGLPGARIRSAEDGRENGTFQQRIRFTVEDAETPITVSKLAERLHARGDEYEYGDVHEALYRDYLQRLDAEGVLVFDMETGLIHSGESGTHQSSRCGSAE